MSNYYKITKQLDSDFFNLVCLAPSAMRVQIPSGSQQPGDFSFTVPYTDQYTMLFIQCSSSYIGVLDMDVSRRMMGSYVYVRCLSTLTLVSFCLPNNLDLR